MKIGKKRLRLRDDDDREIAGPRGDFLADRETVDVRQHDVEDDCVDAILLLQDRHRFETVSRFPRRESPQPQGEAHQASQIVVVFNDQDGLMADRHYWTATPSWTGRRDPVGDVHAALQNALHGISGGHGRFAEGVH